MANTMTQVPAVMRIRFVGAPLAQHCEWALLAAGQEPQYGTGALPPHAGRVEHVLAAADVLLLRCVLPANARNPGAQLLAFAAEECLGSDPAANSVCRLALAPGGESILAVVDKAVLEEIHSALAALGIDEYTTVCETLLLPYEPDTWSLLWHGSEGSVRTGLAEGGATDSGDSSTPPLSLQLWLDAARENGNCPAVLVIHADDAALHPDMVAWSRALDIEVATGPTWRWYGSAEAVAGPFLWQRRRHWQGLAAILPRMQPALWLLIAALGLHTAVLLQAWASLSAEKTHLQDQMESRFRQVFPGAVVVEPVLQMRRQLANARQQAGQADDSGFLPILARVAAVGAVTPGSLRMLSYESGRLTLELSDSSDAVLAPLMEHLRQAGLDVDLEPASADRSASLLMVKPG